MKTIHSFLENSAKELRDKEALVFKDERLAYGEVNELANKVRNFLCANTGKQDRVILLLDNSIEYVISYFGILKSGCVCVPLDVGMTEESLFHRVSAAAPKFVISKAPFQERLKASTALEDSQCLYVDQLLETDYEESRVDVDENDLCTIMFSSGTAGEPKGVALQHANVVSATENIIQYLGITRQDKDVGALKICHSFGLGNIHCYFRQGGTVILERNFVNLKGFLQKVIDEKATSFSATPYVLDMMVMYCKEKLAECDRYLRYIVNDTNLLRKETGISLLKLLPTTKIYTYYGLTEASRSTFHWLDKNDPSRLESVGKAAPNVKVKVVNDDGEELPGSEVGEIAIKGSHVAKGYWKNSTETKKAIRNGWLYTEDLGYFDDDGYLFVVGRKDDVINVGGEKVYPIEIEEVISKHPLVKDCAVVAAPDQLFGQVVRAYCVVEPQSREKITSKDIIKFCDKKLESFKIPKHIEFCDEVPRTDSGKKKRGLLREVNGNG